MAEGKKKKAKVGNETKVNIWKIVNFLIIMISVVYIAVILEVVSIAAVAANASKGEEVFELTVDIVRDTNRAMNRAVLTTMGLFAIGHFINYLLLILKQREILIIAIIAEIVFAVISFNNPLGYVILLPMLSGLVYLRILF